jgi:hypothetical protein
MTLISHTVYWYDTQHNDIQYSIMQTQHSKQMTLISHTVCTMTLSIKTLSIMTLSIMTLSIMTLSIMTLSIMTLSIMTLSIMTLSITIQKQNTRETTLISHIVRLSA